ncbi:extracellular catalytic domain type 1 short-chain-length polyhydroxyalkanoate depolymerase [Hymenobacter weizhouensis]|uniref:extracellular catalytic domain type 1 short-chain-length polyhydroxyalkanoate depolymerase n=1 Tax=Hymenobacter sp. YIM 151500-1 TaxID=2987689 RepID=UPI002226AC1E|nr:PHB depolymerase family esterase [Hymenobacter sp. YIM 151500-1]UYZ61589.1 T9SS type A sorting domain-containing protein [Hymenobacter sp. YIM 151500-1]
MKQLLFCVLLVLLPVLIRAQTTVQGTIRHGGVAREYRLYVPRAYTGSRAVPLLFNLHGYGSSNQEQELYGDFRPIADTANFLVVHPNGTRDALGNRHWNVFLAPGSGGPDDVSFLSALLDSLRLRYQIDPDRVYSTGMSNGGFMSYELACQLSNRVAAIASVTGSMVQSRLAACAPPRPVPVLHIHGTADATVPYTGNALFVPVPDLLVAWARRNGASLTPTITQVPNSNTTDGSTAERQVFGGGRNGSVVEHYRIIGGGHTWPDAPVAIGVTNRDINASREIWRFLRPYRLSRLSVVTTSGTETKETALLVYPNPTTGRLTVQLGTQGGQVAPAAVHITDAAGRSVRAAVRQLGSGAVEVQTTGWAPGVYWLRAEVAGQPQYRRILKQ